ncbi:hypothetical protein [Flavobacterium cerinum]|uniref:Uncharacterized protein n=1 Tax=Flavobacterium cerinum TaxID=2502784 RepID=A0ABY5IUW5_9FLAO|nr:hypothetical protein [Flavobacterium cerinum]UUC46570.1 hypothetical protein NOX80_05060 [Flavobacterium cerinum]
MKKILLIPVLLALSFCNTANTNKATMMTTIESECPSDGKCTVEVFKNKAIDLKTDGLGKLYYQLADDTNKSVVVYAYNRNVEEGLQDGQHKEEIIFEIDNGVETLQLKDGDLSNVKMLFGRHCFCRGQAGFFAVNQGVLNLKQKGSAIAFELDFKIKEVPQVFTQVKATVVK